MLGSGKTVSFMGRVSFSSKMDPTTKALSPITMPMEKAGIFLTTDAFTKAKSRKTTPMVMENIVILFKAIITKVNGEEMFHLEKGRKSFPTAHIMKDSFLMASKTESGAIYQIQVFTKANLRMATSMGKVPLLMSTTVLSREIG